MASFPGPKVHRVNRRKLGRGQHVQVPSPTFVMTDSADTAILTFNVPVVASGVTPLAVAGGPVFVSQAQVSPTVLHVVYNSALTGKVWTLASPNGILSYQGGTVAPATGTF